MRGRAFTWRFWSCLRRYRSRERVVLATFMLKSGSMRSRRERLYMLKYVVSTASTCSQVVERPMSGVKR
eukprot:3033797-Amphidinium_carterae.1